MKKILLLLIILGSLWYFYNLGVKNTKIENAKQEIGINNEDKKEDTDLDIQKKEEPKTSIENNEINKNYSVEYIDNNGFIKLDDLSDRIENVIDNITISGKVLDKGVEEISVSFSNDSSDFADDTYILKTFKKGNNKFRYEADSKLFQNLDFGDNKYLIKAIKGDEEDKILLTININDNVVQNEKELNDKIEYEKKSIGSGDKSLFVLFPYSKSFGKPINIEDGKISYSNISDLSIEKKQLDNSLLDNSNIYKEDGTGYIAKNSYWHIFSNLNYNNKESGVSFFVLKKEDKKIIYEKHYLDFKHNILGILKLGEYDFVDYDNMGELNIQLKDKAKNKEFLEVEKTDKLFKEIVK